MKAQRLRFRYRLTDKAGEFSNRDHVRLWENALMRAGYDVSRSEGKRSAPQIALAAPLPLGVTSECELADVFLSQPANPAEVLRAIKADPPAPGVEPVSIEEIGVDAPSLQSRLRWAEYEVTAEAGLANVAAAIARLVSAASVPAELHRANKVKMYDLRPLVISLRARAGEKERTIITMRLRAAPEMTGRADQVLAALGLSPAERIHRTRLVLEEVPDVIIAYRTRGWAEESGS